MCLKQSISQSKCVLHAILLLTLSTNYIFGSSNFDTAFLPYRTKFCSVFLSYRIVDSMRILKMCIKQSFCHYKWVLHAILFPTHFTNCIFGRSYFDTACLPYCTKWCSVFLSYQIGNLMRILKMCLKQSFSNSKWVLHAILSLTLSKNCGFGSSNFDTAFLADQIL